MDHIRTFPGSSHRIFRDICLDVTELQVVACIQHTAVCIPASLNQIISSLFCRCHEHLRSVKMFCKERLCNLRSKVSKINDQRITSGLFDVFQRLYHVDLTFHDTDRTFVNIVIPVFCFVCIYKGFSSCYGKALRKTVTADCNDSDFHFWHVVHDSFLLFISTMLFHFLSPSYFWLLTVQNSYRQL